LGPPGSALSALMWTIRRIPAALHVALKLRARSTCAR
jgi:hypothetical protein